MTKIGILPRVLIVTGEPCNQTTATGITLSNLFRGMPSEFIAQVYSASVPVDTNVCNKYWKLSSKNLFLVGHLFRLAEAFRRFSSRYRRAPASLKNFNDGYGVTVRRHAKWLDWMPYIIDRKMLSEVRVFKPDVIYTTLGSLRLARLVNRLSREFSVQVVPHFLDDWLSTYDSSGAESLMARIARPRLEAETRRLLEQVPFAMAVSDSMSREYSRRFSIPFETFVNPPDAPIGCPRAFSPEAFTRPLKFVYTGGLHLGRFDVLHEVATVVDRLVKQGHKIELSIYVPQKDTVLANTAFEGLLGVVIYGNVPAKQISTILDESDIAVHVESFEPGFKKYTRLSVSTKIPQYLASGLPVLACCPEDVASGQYLVENGCGIVVGTDSVDALESSLLSLIQHPSTMRQLSVNAIRVARERHDGEIERSKFQMALCRAAGIDQTIAVQP